MKTTTATTTTVYSTIGNVRGNCGHKHTTLAGAIRCLQADQRDCRAARGYSDRVLRVREAGEWRDIEEADISAADSILLYGAV
jgi:hypothetical protein